MLFIQCIKLSYTKNQRYPEYANRRRAIRFLPVEYSGDIDGEVFFHSGRSVKIYGEDAFAPEKIYDARYGNRIAVTKDCDRYSVMYRDDDCRFKSKFNLKKGEYGRLMFNERSSYDHIIFYYVHIYNFVNTEKSNFRRKIFYRKTADHEYRDMKILR